MPLLNNAVIIVSGTIKIFANKKWKQHFCVIAKTSPFAATPKLFLYKEATDYKKSIDLSAQLPYATVYGLDSVSNSDKSPVSSTIVLMCEDRLLLLGFNSYVDLTFWLGKISDSLQDASYRARFVKSESVGKLAQQPPLPLASEGASVDGRLHVQPSRLCFYTEPAEACKCLAVWPLEFVKRYMVNEAMTCFVFEGDIGCGKFRGMQYFQCEKRYEIYADMKAACVNKPMPSLSQSCGGGVGGGPAACLTAAKAAGTGGDPRRPVSSCIEIPQPRGGSPRQGVPGDDKQQRPRHCHLWYRHQPHCPLHRRQQQPPLQTQGPQLTVDSGYEGGGSRNQSVVFGAAGAAAAGVLSPYFASSAAAAGSREYYNLVPRNLAATDTPPADCPVGQLASGGGEFARSLSVGEQPDPFQQRFHSAADGHCRSRLVRSSIDIREESDPGAAGAAGANASCDCVCECDCCGEIDESDCGCCCGSHYGSDGYQPTSALQPAAASASAGADLRTRKPRHGFEYASRERVTSAFCDSVSGGGDGGCYANLQHLQETLQRQQLPNCRSAPAAQGPSLETDDDRRRRQRHSVLTYAMLDHSAAAPVPAGTQLQHPLRLNYTEVDHWKTSAFREIAAERSRPPPPGRAISASSGNSGGYGGRRSLIRLFQRGTSLRND